MNRLILLLAFNVLLYSCHKEVSQSFIDDYASTIDENIKNQRLQFKKISGFENSFQEMTCFYRKNKLVCIRAEGKSSFDQNTYSFYLSEGRLVLSRIEIAMLKEKYWDVIEPIAFNSITSNITREDSYFMDHDARIIRINGGKWDKLSRDREKTITDQFTELLKLSESYQ